MLDDYFYRSLCMHFPKSLVEHCGNVFHHHVRFTPLRCIVSAWSALNRMFWCYELFSNKTYTYQLGLRKLLIITHYNVIRYSRFSLHFSMRWWCTMNKAYRLLSFVENMRFLLRTLIILMCHTQHHRMTRHALSLLNIPTLSTYILLSTPPPLDILDILIIA